MSGSILHTISSNCDNGVIISKDISQITDNTSNELISTKLDIEFNTTINMNSREISYDTNITTYNMPSRSPIYTYRKEIYNITFEKNIILNSKISENIYELATSCVKRKGTIRLLNEDMIDFWNSTNITNLIYNNDVLNYIVDEDKLDTVGIKRLNLNIMKCNNNIPISITDDIITVIESCSKDNIFIQLQITNNIIKNMIRVADNHTNMGANAKVYIIKFYLYFDMEVVDKFPISYPQRDMKMNSQQLNSYPIEINYYINYNGDFITDLRNKKYNNIYIIF